VEDIRRWHKQQGWSDIGYHYVIGRHGEQWKGRDVDVSGAHCEGHNRNSIGVCYIGGLDETGKKAKDTRTLQQKAVLLSLLTELKRLYPDAKIYGHRDFARKDCPSFDAKKEYLSI
jgi:N-acetylmuramoyl-L-alanine amidase